MEIINNEFDSKQFGESIAETSQDTPFLPLEMTKRTENSQPFTYT
jgi:hypothetical protein